MQNVAFLNRENHFLIIMCIISNWRIELFFFMMDYKRCQMKIHRKIIKFFFMFNLEMNIPITIFSIKCSFTKRSLKYEYVMCRSHYSILVCIQIEHIFTCLFLIDRNTSTNTFSIYSDIFICLTIQLWASRRWLSKSLRTSIIIHSSFTL